MRTFDTTSIDLTSAIITVVSEARLVGIDRQRSVNGKSIIRIEYLDEKADAVEKARKDFDNKVLIVSLYDYNTNRRYVLDKVLGRERRWKGSGDKDRDKDK